MTYFHPVVVSSTFLSLLAFVILIVYHRCSRRFSSRVEIHRTILSIQRSLNPPGAEGWEILAARARPNARLIRAFSLTNTFVSPNPAVHSEFVGQAILRLRTSTKRGWSVFQRITVDAVIAALADAKGMDFDTFVQDVTMRVALVGLLDIDSPVSELDSDSIKRVAILITELWALSKRSDPISPSFLLELNEHLRVLIPDEAKYPNPLDYVIPIWETLWRVVATTVAYAHQHPLADNNFSNLMLNPTIVQFRCSRSSPSVEWFVTEAMRLHPPSKHLTRHTSIAPPFLSFFPSILQPLMIKVIGPIIVNECADIGGVLRSASIWGADADTFDPSRFAHGRITREQEVARSLPFGHGLYKCVAAAWAPMAAGIISASILEQLGTKSDYRLMKGPSVGTREGWSGWVVVRR